MGWKVFVLVLCVSLIKGSAGLKCYACSFSSGGSDRSCLEITETTNIVDCPHPYCIIFRQEFVDPKGFVSSFIRGCESQPDFLNHEIIDPTFRTFYRACTSDLCNIGDGIQSITGGNLAPYQQQDGDNLLVPGTRAAAAGRVPSTTLTATLPVLYLAKLSLY